MFTFFHVYVACSAHARESREQVRRETNMKSETNEGEMELESGKSAERLTNRGKTNRDEYIPREMKRIDCWAGAYFHIDECRSH